MKKPKLVHRHEPTGICAECRRAGLLAGARVAAEEERNARASSAEDGEDWELGRAFAAGYIARELRRLAKKKATPK